MMTVTAKGEGRARGSAPETGRADPRYGRHRQAGAGRSWRIFRRSVCGYAPAALAVLAFGISWSLGLVGCAPVPGSSYRVARPGAFFPKVRQAPEEVSRLLRNAHYYKLMGRPELALKELEQAHQQDPDNPKLVNTLAQNYEELGQFETARKIYREALARHGSHPALANNLCFAYYLEGLWQEAETCYRQTLARDPGNEAARNNLGLLFCRLGRQDEARRLWQDVEGKAAAEYKTRQAMAALGMTDLAVYAQAPDPAPPSQAAITPTPVAALPPPPTVHGKLDSPAASLAPQKVALQLAAKPEPEKPESNDINPLDGAQPLPAPEKASSTPATPLATGMSDHAVYARAPEPVLQVASTAPPVAAVPPSPTAFGELDSPAASPAPQKVEIQLANKPEPVKPVSHNGELINEVQDQPISTNTSPDPAPALRANPRLRPAPLTAAELVATAIEVRNGTPTPHLAREMRSLLELEGFTVAKIGNHVDFRAEKTMIFYRAEAQRVAKALQTDMLPMARLEQTTALKGTMAIKVLLGRDFLKNQDLMARLGENKAQPQAAVTALPAPLPPPKSRVPEAQTPRQSVSAPLTAAELVDTAIEVRNGTPAPHLARRMRSLLNQEGFTVARIGNHINFGAEKTMIFYRPEAERVARALGQTFFPGAGLEPNMSLNKDIVIKILLGADFLERPLLLARRAAEEE